MSILTAVELIKLLQEIDPDTIVQMTSDDGFYCTLEYWDGESGDWIVLWDDEGEDDGQTGY